MIGNALGYSAVTCFMLLSSSCSVVKGVTAPPPATPAQQPAPTSSPSHKASQPAGPSYSPFSLGPETVQEIQQDAGPAVKALLSKAREQEAEDQAAQAIATLERALNIEPHNPQLYRQLARLHMHMGNAAEAEALALKSNSLAGGNRRLQARNWLLIAKARTEQGDSRGAADAQRRANNLRSGLPAGR